MGAPYEADAQLEFLCKEGLVWAVVTVDSDFIIHGMQRIFFKVNWRSGRCMFYERRVLENPGGTWLEAHSTDFLQMVAQGGVQALLCYALVCGCDYGTKVRGVGPARSVKVMKLATDEHGLGLLRDTRAAIPVFAGLIEGYADSDFSNEGWMTKATNAVVVFENALAYDPTKEQVVTVQGEHCSTACVKWPFLGEAVPDHQAVDRSLGCLDPQGNTVPLPPVPVVSMPFVRWELTEEMIPGAKLPPPAHWGITCPIPTMDQLRDFLRSRHGQPLLSGENKDTLLKAVKDLMAVEAAEHAVGRRIRLRDPTGKSLQQHLLEANPDKSWHFTEGHGDPITLPEEGWITDKQEIVRSAGDLEWTLIIGQ